jgi:ferric-dicitrate binding protein FerR (iron transport regulator)
MENIYKLLPLFFKNQCTAEQITAVKNWKKENAEEFNELQSIWSLSKDHNYIQFDEKSAWQELRPQLIDNKTKVIPISFFLKITAAAAVLLLSVWGGIQVYENQSNKIEIAKDEANGSTTKLRGVNLVSENNVEKTNLKSGDKIWLNKNSRLEDFGSDNGRYAVKVHLGEAFFDIKSRENAHDEPFLVYTHNASISVTGTQFSVSVNNNQTIVTVVSGKVKVITGKINQLILNKGEKVVVENGSFNEIGKPALNDISWKTGKFDFVDTPLPLVVSQLNSFYSAQIDLASDSALTFTGEFNNDSLADVLSSLSKTSELNVEEVDKNKYYILSSK